MRCRGVVVVVVIVVMVVVVAGVEYRSSNQGWEVRGFHEKMICEERELHFASTHFSLKKNVSPPCIINSIPTISS